MIKFNDYELTGWISKALCRMGYNAPTPVQQLAVNPIGQGKDVLVQAPTGTGKTCAFSIPLCQQMDTKKGGIQALILSPTRELVLQTANTLRSLTFYNNKIKIAVVYGGVSINKQIRELKSKPHIVIATPGRLVDHIKRCTIDMRHINAVVLDEADNMLDMGFIKDINWILGKTPEKKQMALFSATLNKEVIAISQKYQREALSIKIPQKAMTVSSVKQYYTKLSTGSKTGKLEQILRNDESKLSLVFVNTKRMADRLSRTLVSMGYNSASLHGDLTQKQREKVMGQYRQGKYNILVATDVAARGIDVKDIDVVINYDLPQDADSYVHRIGRTGRANKNGLAYTFIYHNEMGKFKTMMKITKSSIENTEQMGKAI